MASRLRIMKNSINCCCINIGDDMTKKGDIVEIAFQNESNVTETHECIIYEVIKEHPREFLNKKLFDLYVFDIYSKHFRRINFITISYITNIFEDSPFLFEYM